MSAVCGCIKKDYNFALSSMDSKTLLYQDLSIWMQGPQFTIPETYVVGITLPTMKEPVYVRLSTQNISMLTSVELMNTTTPQDLPDGIYCFIVDENSSKEGYCGTSFMRTRAVTQGLECCRDSILAMAPSSPQSIPDTIQLLDFYIDATKVNAELGKDLKAQEFYQLAKDLCKQWNCDCNSPKMI